ncbi:methyl-accepting chemotaxis protein [Shewanella salipaludis]|uniref:Methyl-accepting chemotaxis protein n=1 Tax=Shewanella salipaludis TaxID=2723052 RepID=A0A972G2P5_9GAMM|nr:methyl-accepting chemotaxis protein [Shewanella salipaludis]NMH66406.1 methyl-accepting chemotaxis protein [Shewanella salipaludis]
MLIRSKLLLSATLSIMAVVAMFGLQRYSSHTQTALSLAISNVVELEKEVLLLRKDEKDFFARLDLDYVAHTKLTHERISDLSQSLQQTLVDYDISTQSLDGFSRSLSNYSALFNDVVVLQQEIGLTPKSGLYGELREAVHNVESLLKDFNESELEIAMLQLRRSEKDFMLRRDLKYVDGFNANFADFNQRLQSSSLASNTKGEIQRLMQQYQTAFAALVTKEQQLGLSSNDGKMAKLRDAVAQTEVDSEALKQQTVSAIRNVESNVFIIGLVAFLVITLLLCVVTYLIVRSIIDPINSINKVISNIEINKDLTQRCEIASQDEIGQIAVHFNRMVESFQQLIEQVIESIGGMNQSCSELSHNAGLTSQGVGRQLNETDMVATAITEMGATIEEIAKNTELAAAKASETHVNAQDGQLGVEQTIEKIQALAQQLDESARVVGELEHDSATIGSVLDVIRGIAEQTNLLALNAAIEAARAGEQGRGFAVVADEVRSLAMRTQESTQEIANIIQTLQSRTRSIVQLMEASQQQGADSAKQAATAGTLLQQINADVTNIMDMSTQIAAAIEEQSMVAAEVNKNVVVIRDIAEESSHAAAENASSSNEVKSRAEFLFQAVSQFKI